jgi:hypothetical protein
MRNIVAALLFAFGSAHAQETDSILRYKVAAETSSLEASHVNTVVPAYISAGKDASLDSLQCPIPKSDRVKNFTGIQCVWSSIETLGRWSEDGRLTKPPLTSRPQCKSYSGPGQAAAVLNSLGVRFEQTYGNKEKGLAMIRRAMDEGRGVLFDVPGHAMVLVHFSEEDDRACWVDNADNSLKVQTSTVDRFMNRWASWVLIVHSEPDVVPWKAYRRFIPVMDADPPFSSRPVNFVPFPD